jgi:hypothetical protein
VAEGCGQGRPRRVEAVLDRLAKLSAAGLSPGQPPVTYTSANLGTGGDTIPLVCLWVGAALALERFSPWWSEYSS